MVVTENNFFTITMISKNSGNKLRTLGINDLRISNMEHRYLVT
jgi:hypothetical protein